MNVLSLFSGIGGLDLGLEAHGCTTVAYSEVNEYAASVMDGRFLNAVNVGDITQLVFERNENGTCYIEQRDTGEGFWLPPIDIICGGFPCQDISAAWNGPGITGERSGLWRHYAEAIRGLRPRGVLVENVSNLAKRGLDVVLGDLAQLGYDAEWGVLRAGDFGAPHERARLFLVAYPDVSGCEEQRRGRPTATELSPAERDGALLPGVGDQAASLAMATFARVPAVSTWEAEPRVGRVVDGLPSRVDRLRCLGNAVVPQVAEFAAGILIDRMER